MTTLITGGTGLIGTTLADQLLSRGERVVLFDVALPEARVAALRRHGERLRLVRGDVQALGEMISVIRAEQVEAIVHLAFVLGGVGNAEPERASRVNVLGTVNALEAARLTGVPRVILASSIAVYGSDDQYSAAELPLGEDAARHVCRTLLIYGGGKLYTEHLAHVYARTYGLVTGGLRPSVVYGPGRDSGGSAFLNEVIEKPALGEPVTVGFGDAGISFVHVEDVAGQFAALLRCDAGVFASAPLLQYRGRHRHGARAGGGRRARRARRARHRHVERRAGPRRPRDPRVRPRARGGRGLQAPAQPPRRRRPRTCQRGEGPRGPPAARRIDARVRHAHRPDQRHASEHAGKRNEQIYRTAEHLARAVAHLNALEPRPDVVLATGDLVERGEAGEYERLREQLEPLRMPVYLVPGNHDDRVMLPRVLDRHRYLPRDGGFIQYTVEDWPVRLVALDTLIPGESGGRLCAERLAWLDARLAEAPRAADRGVHAPPAVRHRHEEDGRDGARRHRRHSPR